MPVRRIWTLAAVLVPALLLGTVAQATTIAHWTFEEGTIGQPAAGAGSVLDVSGNGHDGTPSNGPQYVAAPGGTGLDFDGINDYVRVTDSADFISNSLTVEAIVSLDTLPAGAQDLRQIVFRGDTVGGRDPFYLAVFGNKIRWLIQGPGGGPGTAIALVTPDPVPTSEFFHIAGIIDDATDTMSLYLNGALVATTSAGGRRPTVPISLANSAQVTLGALHSGAGQFLDGTIAEVRISDVALGADQFLIASVPEPGTLALLVVAPLLLGARLRARAGVTAGVAHRRSPVSR